MYSNTRICKERTAAAGAMLRCLQVYISFLCSCSKTRPLKACLVGAVSSRIAVSTDPEILQLLEAELELDLSLALTHDQQSFESQ